VPGKKRYTLEVSENWKGWGREFSLWKEGGDIQEVEKGRA